MENMKNELIQKDYLDLLKNVKEEIRKTYNRMLSNAVSDITVLYFNIGKHISETRGYGKNTVENLSKDLSLEFSSGGFSETNLKAMRRFYEAYKEYDINTLPVLRIPWRSNIALLSYVKDSDERIWYANKVLNEGWSKNVLVNMISSGDYQRSTSEKVTNFDKRLPAPSNNQVKEMLKDPYAFPFITNKETKKELAIEHSMVDNISKVLIEFGKGWAYCGEQVGIIVSGVEYHIDLLFYNINLRRYFVIELKPGAFKPTHVGQLNFYVSAVDSLMKKDNDEPTIGILFCRKKDKLTAEFSLRNIESPIGVVDYKLFDDMPDFLAEHLPTTKEIESRIKILEKNGIIRKKDDLDEDYDDE
jgi:predicted nuclease of restriction endonuclease-like (RecB) superfamily